MALDRDELAARCLVAMLPRIPHGGNGESSVRASVQFADALLAELASAAPVAATPAYVPKVGDVVHGLYGDDTLARITYVAPSGKSGRASGFGRNQSPDTFVAFTDDIRPATPAERASAGLDAPAAPPVDESAVDRVALAKVLRAAFHRAVLNNTRDTWDDCTETGKRGYLAEADAAIAFLRGGAK